jgi:hypothetical protein
MKLSFFFLLLTGIWGFPASAYVGPGAGLSLIGTLYTLIGGVILALFAVVFYPARLLYKKWKKKKNHNAAPSIQENTPNNIPH